MNQSTSAKHVWGRTCQECFNIQEDNEPFGPISTGYSDRKCKKCKSSALDYGHRSFRYNKDNKLEDARSEEGGEEEEEN